MKYFLFVFVSFALLSAVLGGTSGTYSSYDTKPGKGPKKDKHKSDEWILERPERERPDDMPMEQRQRPYKEYKDEDKWWEEGKDYNCACMKSCGKDPAIDGECNAGRKITSKQRSFGGGHPDYCSDENTNVCCCWETANACKNDAYELGECVFSLLDYNSGKDKECKYYL
mmetsp:Transcript_30419/g.39252  ORF Transcript_30419/g.39252 Transcript_30419/m.39252 type:complete len:170 (+) Transcript_30419:286-795(+)